MKFLLLLLSVTILSSCISNSRCDVEFFINKDKNIKYFFPSTEWETDDATVRFEADILHRDYVEFSIINFTLHSKSTLFRDKPENFKLYNEHYSIVIPKENIEIIYIDKDKTRYTSKIKTSDLNSLFKTSDYIINISFNIEKDYLLQSSKQFKEHIIYYKKVILGIEF